MTLAVILVSYTTWRVKLLFERYLAAGGGTEQLTLAVFLLLLLWFAPLPFATRLLLLLPHRSLCFSQRSCCDSSVSCQRWRAENFISGEKAHRSNLSTGTLISTSFFSHLPPPSHPDSPHLLLRLPLPPSLGGSAFCFPVFYHIFLTFDVPIAHNFLEISSFPLFFHVFLPLTFSDSERSFSINPPYRKTLSIPAGDTNRNC